jgi:ribosomal protein S18 acetylase RimI-like enzyme
MTGDQGITVRPLKDEFLIDVARIHRTGLGYTVNSRLGTGHVAFLYQTMSREPDCYVGVALADDHPVGVVSGTVNPENLKAAILRSSSIWRVLGIAIRLLVQPWLLLRLWQGNVIAAPVQYNEQAVTAVLTAIAVDPRARGQGVGRQLVAALEAFFADHNITSYRLDTLVKNKQASAFYRGLGFLEVPRRAGSLIFVKVIER